MFEDIEDYMKKNRQDVDGGGKGVAEDIIKKIAQLAGADDSDVSVESVPGGTMVTVKKGVPNMGHIQSFVLNVPNVLIEVGTAAGLKPHCVDAAGRELHVGDLLKAPSNLGKPTELKLVMAVGYGYAMLSDSNDHAKLDGPWFEQDMAQLNFLLDKPAKKK
jgi:hypothetical protein